MRGNGQGAGRLAVTGGVRTMMPFTGRWSRRHDDVVVRLVRDLDPASIHDVGCGDGTRVLRWTHAGLTAWGSDDSGTAVDRARDRAFGEGLDDSMYSVRRVHHLEAHVDTAELVVCCGVLERISDPDLALRRLQIVTERYLVVSATRWPWPNLLNLACGRYWTRSGRSPSQANIWTRSAFADLLSRYFVVEKVMTPFPWTILLCRAQTDTQVVRHLGSP